MRFDHLLVIRVEEDDFMSIDSRDITPEERMIRLITKYQSVLHRYICALIQDPYRADDVLQETNLVLWHKAVEYDPSRPFLPWARGVAWQKVKAATRDISRDRLIFGESTLQVLSEEAEHINVYMPTQQELALADCIADLSSKKKELLQERYVEGVGVKTLAKQLQRPAASISHALYQIRVSLKNCVRRKIATAKALR